MPQGGTLASYTTWLWLQFCKQLHAFLITALRRAALDRAKAAEEENKFHIILLGNLQRSILKYQGGFLFIRRLGFLQHWKQNVDPITVREALPIIHALSAGFLSVLVRNRACVHMHARTYTHAHIPTSHSVTHNIYDALMFQE